jgi:uncharacterized protein YfaS (alpha-2-macroglobulin family)/outer membrane protein assembly factor BamD (BamD/ComL family)
MSRLIFGLILFTGTVLTMPTQARQFGVEHDPLWKAVQAELNEGRPQTALEKLAPIMARAEQAGDVAEKIRVITFRFELEAYTAEDATQDTRLKKMRAAIDSADPALRPVMEAIQASWFWEFFQQNQWQFAQRTAVAGNAAGEDGDKPVPGPNDDLLTWDLQRILRAIDGQFARSLKESDALKQIPIAEYGKLIRMGNVPAKYRPTMYDILVHHALAFYSSGQQVGSRSVHAFDLQADSPALGSLEEFLAWQPKSADDRNPTLVALKLYQDLLRFHQADDDPTAKFDADLQRIEFAYNQAIGESKKARYESALKRFQSAASDSPVWSSATASLAQLAFEGNNYVLARQLASEGLERFPDSVGANECFNLIQQVEARSAQATTERVWNAPWPTIAVDYRNVTKVYFRLVPFNFQQFATSNQSWQPEAMDEQTFQQVIGSKPVKQWSADLPATKDYLQRQEVLPVPQDLPLGSYLLLAGHREDFSDLDNQISVAEVWVSNLALSIRTGESDGVVSGHVLDANTGLTIGNAKVQAWQFDRNGQRVVEIPAETTNEEGEFVFKSSERQRLVLLASNGKDRLSSANMINVGRYDQHIRKTEQTLFFTDRSIYRPGQTIRYKGVCHSYDQANDNYQVIPSAKVVVALFDANNKEVERLEHRSNEYGSFNGSFTAPRGRLTGAMYLRVVDGAQGQGNVRVEEYKRPKFEVDISAPEIAAKLGEEVTVKGKATAYTGAVIDGANVQWRVVREVRYPPWWFWRCWWMPQSGNERQEIARGTTTTESDGSFKVTFTARPDLGVSPDSEPTFHFTVHADVTDGTGETRSADRSVNVGYTALKAELSTDQWQTSDKLVELTIGTSTLDGIGQAAEGTVKVYALKQPEKVVRSNLTPNNYMRWATGSQPPQDMSNPNSWQTGEVVFESAFKTDAAGQQKLQVELPAGAYRAKLTTKDRFGKAVTAETPIAVLDLQAPRSSIKVPHQFTIQESTIEPGETFRALWSSGYEQAQAFFEVEHRGKMLKRFWSAKNKSQSLVELPVTEEMRGGFTVHIAFVRENRAYHESHRVNVPWSNKDLNIKWERFTSKLGPAQKETWTAVITGNKAEKAAAEVVATLYDASLDVFAPHGWQSSFGVFRHDHSRLNRQFGNVTKHFQFLRNNWTSESRDIRWDYPMLDLPPNHGGGMGMGGMGGGGMGGMGGAFGGSMRKRSMMRGAVPMMAPMAEAMDAAPGGMGGMGGGMGDTTNFAIEASSLSDSSGDGSGRPSNKSTVKLDGVPVRTNLNETAFFLPQVTAGEDGSIKLEFTMPEALTRWKFMGFAHDKKLRGGLLTDTVTTSKDLMIQPNAPRFLREGDLIEVTVKVTNLSPTRQTGQAALNFSDPITGDSLDKRLDNTAGQLDFDIPAGATKALAWRIKVPDDITTMTYKAMASTGRISDGEEGYLPVLSRRILVTESLPLPIRGQQSKDFNFKRLLESKGSTTIQHQSLTVQMASNPSWYAVMSLPYLMEYPHQCSEQIFNRFYANSLAHRIATSDPKIEKVFDQWRGTPALDSPLTKNQDLKAVLLEESPWQQAADTESQSRRNVGILFDQNRLNDEMARALAELAERQLPDGRWSWFPGGTGNDYITLYITTGFGRLQHLGAKFDPAAAIRSLGSLDNWMAMRHREALQAMKQSKWKPGDKLPNFLDSTIAMYLYGRSFFSTEHPIGPQHQESLKFWLEQCKLYWLQLPSLQSQGHLAIALNRLGDKQTSTKIMVSLKERSLTNEEMGTYWRSAPEFYWWYHAPIESQAVLIEAFDEVARDAVMVENCKVWLLKQKQTQNWKTTKATADAVYALLLRGTNVFASDKIVQVSLAGELVRPDAVEAGTGFYEKRRVGDEVKPEMAQVSVTKRDDGVAWGSVHWQYFEDIDKITSNTDNPLKLSKELYVKQNTDTGPQLQQVGQGGEAAGVKVGDELVVRVVLKVDRDMEYVHLKDHRGSGTEPVNVLSGYRYQDGLGYYESTRDAASHFFIDYLRKGTYVFEYSTRVQLRGNYSTGMAQVQCMYAPEFNSHSQSIRMDAK